jgi:hypothetical protein
MPTDKKLIIAVVVLAVLGGAVLVQRQKERADLAAHSLESEAAKLPKLAVSDDDVKKIDKVELHRSPAKDTEKAEDIVLVKKGDEDWDLDKPVSAKANASSVKSMLDDLKRLEAKELIDAGKDNYAKYKLTDDKALHAVFYKGKDVVLDAYFGEDGTRGQMTRLGGKDGVYATKGYSSYVFNKSSSDWRDKTIFKFEEKDVVKVSLQNENGAFEFDKSGDDWKAKYGPKTASKDIENFDKTKLESLVRAYKGLTAADFGDDKKPDDVGLATPKETLIFELKDGTAKDEIDFGNAAEGSNRWAKRNGSDVLFTVSSWAGDWAVAKVDKFQKTDDKKADKDKDKDKKDKDAKPAGLTLSNPAPTGG